MRVEPQPDVTDRPPLPSNDTMAVEAVAESRHAGAIKWFDVTRGFGFLVDDDQAGDILIHFSVLQPHGRRSLPEGARVECRAVKRQRGLQATEILSIDLSTAIEPAPRPTYCLPRSGTAGPLTARLMESL